MKRRILAVGGLGLVAALAAGPGWALWASAASGNASAMSADMPAGGTPTSPAVGNTPTTSANVSVAWPAANYVGPSPAVPVPSYIVKRYVGITPVADANPLSAGCGGSSGIVTGLSCIDTLPAAGVYSYSVTPVHQVAPASGNWVGTEGAKSGTVTYAPASTAGAFVVTAPGTATAGAAFNVTIQAKNGVGANDTTYTGAKSITISGPANSPNGTAPSLPTTANFNASGLATVSVTLVTVETVALAVSDGTAARSASSGNVAVSAASPALSFSTCQSPIVKNNTFSTKVTRTGADPYGNLTGTVAINVTLDPFDANANASNHNFTVQTVTLGTGDLQSADAIYHTANGNGTSTFTATATGYTTASCAVTTINSN